MKASALILNQVARLNELADIYDCAQNPVNQAAAVELRRSAAKLERQGRTLAIQEAISAQPEEILLHLDTRIHTTIGGAGYNEHCDYCPPAWRGQVIYH